MDEKLCLKIISICNLILVLKYYFVVIYQGTKRKRAPEDIKFQPKNITKMQQKAAEEPIKIPNNDNDINNNDNDISKMYPKLMSHDINDGSLTKYIYKCGYIPKGNDIEMKIMSTNDARIHALKLKNCIGFTSNLEYNANKKIKIWFKKGSSIVKKNDKWQSYLKPKYKISSGFLSRGNDIIADTMTVNEAKEYALTLPFCTGFTFRKINNNDVKTKIWFKNSLMDVSPSNDWVTYLFE
mmetsp:Transcript_9292/g.11641  ORF Transcript_9292/g.11641 Transcript_9292/m.11641 type:complete len:239 (-) Transcript_9292:131-847(-)